MSDFVKSLNKDVHEIEIENELIIKCKAAHSKYNIDLQDAVLSSTNDEKSRKQEMIHVETEGTKRRKADIVWCVKSLTKNVNTYYDRTENEGDMSLLIIGNAIIMSIISKQELIKLLDVAMTIIIIKTLFTLGLERKIYRNEMITGKDKKVTQASHSRASGLQARLRETSNPKNSKTPRRTHRKFAHYLLWI